jgi:hypothetical protein
MRVLLGILYEIKKIPSVAPASVVLHVASAMNCRFFVKFDIVLYKKLSSKREFHKSRHTDSKGTKDVVPVLSIFHSRFG